MFCPSGGKGGGGGATYLRRKIFCTLSSSLKNMDVSDMEWAHPSCSGPPEGEVASSYQCGGRDRSSGAESGIYRA